MSQLNISTQNIVKELAKLYPDTTKFKKKVIVEVGQSLGYKRSDWSALLDSENRVATGTYDLSAMIIPIRETFSKEEAKLSMQSIVNDEKNHCSN